MGGGFPPQNPSTDQFPLTSSSPGSSLVPAGIHLNITRIRASPSDKARHRLITQSPRLVDTLNEVESIRHFADLRAVVQTPFPFAAGRDIDGCRRPRNGADSAGHAGGVKVKPGLGVASRFGGDWWEGGSWGGHGWLRMAVGFVQIDGAIVAGTDVRDVDRTTQEIGRIYSNSNMRIRWPRGS
jgi:hypothetical protein